MAANTHTVTATARRSDNNPNMDEMPRGSSHWRVTLKYKGRQMTVPFSMGPAHSHEPTADEVLECLASDAAGFDNSSDFDDWASSLGFDSGSRRTERVYKAIEFQTAELRRFLDNDYEAIVYHEEV